MTQLLNLGSDEKANLQQLVNDSRKNQIFKSPHAVLFLCQSDVTLNVSKQNFQLQTGDFCYIPKKTSFEVISMGDSNNASLGYVHIFSQQLFDAYPNAEDKAWLALMQGKEGYMLRTPKPTWLPFMNNANVLIDEQTYQRAGYLTIIELSLVSMLIHFHRTFENYKGVAKKLPEKQKLFQTIDSYIHENFARELTTKKLAALFYTSEGTINRLFRKYADTTLHQRVIIRRLSVAKSLLEAGHPAQQVAEQVGFNSYTSFYRQFHKYFGFSPKQFQSTLQANHNGNKS